MQPSQDSLPPMALRGAQGALCNTRGFIIIPPVLLSLPHFWEEPQILHAIMCAAQNLKTADLQWERNIEVKTVPGPLHSLPRRSLSSPLPSQIYLGGQFWGSLHRKGYDPSHGCPPNVSVSIGAIASGFLMTVQGYPLERQQLKLTRHFGVTIHSEFCWLPRQCYGLLVGDHIILVPPKIIFVPRFWSPRDKSLCFPDFLDFKLLSPVIISLPFPTCVFYLPFPCFWFILEQCSFTGSEWCPQPFTSLSLYPFTCAGIVFWDRQWSPAFESSVWSSVLIQKAWSSTSFLTGQCSFKWC